MSPAEVAQRIPAALLAAASVAERVADRRAQARALPPQYACRVECFAHGADASRWSWGQCPVQVVSEPVVVRVQPAL